MDVVAREPVVRLGCFLAAFVLIALWEALAPRRQPAVGRVARWPGNLGIVLLNTLLVRAGLPLTAVGAAALADTRSWGLLNNLGDVPAWVAIPLAVGLLDLAIYLQHVMFHAVPALWRLHRMHHADLDVDVTTGVRFHPLEIVLSMGLKLGVIAALGPPPAAVLLFEIALTTLSMWSHGNLRLPDAVDHVLRWVVVTPDMHRVHHSVVPTETNSNFGFNLSWWDCLGGTYRAQPQAGHQAMTLGIARFREPAWLRLDRLLIQPFVGDAEDAAALPRTGSA